MEVVTPDLLNALLNAATAAAVLYASRQLKEILETLNEAKKALGIEQERATRAGERREIV